MKAKETPIRVGSALRQSLRRVAGCFWRSESPLAKASAEQGSSRFFRDKVRIRWTKFPSSLAKVPHTLKIYSHMQKSSPTADRGTVHPLYEGLIAEIPILAECEARGEEESNCIGTEGLH